MGSWSPPGGGGGGGGGTLHVATMEKTDTQYFGVDVPGLITFQTKYGIAGDLAAISLGPPSVFLPPVTGWYQIGGNIYWQGSNSYQVTRLNKLDSTNTFVTTLLEIGAGAPDNSTGIPPLWWFLTAGTDRIGIEAQTGSASLGVHGDTFGVKRNIVSFAWAT